MNNSWLEISTDGVDSQKIESLIQARISQDHTATGSDETINPQQIAQTLWHDMFGQALAEKDKYQFELPLIADSDIVPRDYQITWQNPVLGLINALIRRLINTEIRRFLSPSLEKQTIINKQLIQAVQTLAEDNQQLRVEIKRLQQTEASPQ